MDTAQVMTQDEIQINLWHIMGALLDKWKKLLVWALAGVLLGGAYGAFTMLGDDPGAASASLTDSASFENMRLAATYRQQYEQTQGYIDTSPYMSLNSEEMYVHTIKYYISNCGEADLNLIGLQLQTFMEDTDLRTSLSETLGLQNDADLGRMVSSAYTVDNNIKAVYFNLSVLSGDEGQTEAAATLVREAVTAKQNELKRRYSFDVQELEDHVSFTRNTGVRDNQNTILQQLNAAKDSYTKLEEAFDEEQLALYREYFLSGETIPTAPEELTVSNDLSKTIKKIIKYTIIAAFVLLLAGCVLYGFSYILSERLKTPEEVQDRFGLSLVSYIRSKPKKKFILNQWADRLMHNGFPEASSVSYAAAVIQKADNATVLYDTSNKLMEALAQTIENDNGTDCIPLLSRSQGTLDQLQTGDRVILMAQLGKTTYEEIRREMDVCKWHGIDVAGMIVVE